MGRPKNLGLAKDDPFDEIDAELDQDDVGDDTEETEEIEEIEETENIEK